MSARKLTTHQQAIAALKARRRELAKVRDALRRDQENIEELLDVSNRAFEALEDAIAALSELV